jgi:hypothetical protein
MPIFTCDYMAQFIEPHYNFHPKTNGQSRKVIQIVENMLCVCGFVIGESGAYVCLGWNLHRNSYQFSSQVTPFEALYDR